MCFLSLSLSLSLCLSICLCLCLCLCLWQGVCPKASDSKLANLCIILCFVGQGLDDGFEAMMGFGGFGGKK